MSLSGKELRHQDSPVTLTQQRVNTTEHFKGKGKGGNRFHKRFSHPLSFSFTDIEVYFSGNPFTFLGDTLVSSALTNNPLVM